MRPAAPRDARGKFVSTACPRENCGSGTLKFEGSDIWRCDGLADPGDVNKPLVACDFTHIDGEHYT